jgi:hypothetical protein
MSQDSDNGLDFGGNTVFGNVEDGHLKLDTGPGNNGSNPSNIGGGGGGGGGIMPDLGSLAAGGLMGGAMGMFAGGMMGNGMNSNQPPPPQANT